MRDKILEYIKTQEAPLGGVIDIPGKGVSAILTAALIPTLITLEECDFAQRCALYLTYSQRKDGSWVNHHGEISMYDAAYIGRHLDMAYNSFGEEDYVIAAAKAYDYLIEQGGDINDMIGCIHPAVSIGDEYLRWWVRSYPTRFHDLLLAAELLVKGRKQKSDKKFLIELAKRYIRPDGLVAFTTDGEGSDIAATALLGVLDKTLAPACIEAIEPWVNSDGSLPVIAGTEDKSAWVSKFVLDLYKAAE